MKIGRLISQRNSISLRKLIEMLLRNELKSKQSSKRIPMLEVQVLVIANHVVRLTAVVRNIANIVR